MGLECGGEGSGSGLRIGTGYISLSACLARLGHATPARTWRAGSRRGARWALQVPPRCPSAAAKAPRTDALATFVPRRPEFSLRRPREGDEGIAGRVGTVWSFGGSERVRRLYKSSCSPAFGVFAASRPSTTCQGDCYHRSYTSTMGLQSAFQCRTNLSCMCLELGRVYPLGGHSGGSVPFGGGGGRVLGCKIGSQLAWSGANGG